MLDALRIPHLELEGYEADDIIATLATEAAREGLEVLILTGDRDSLQLVTETCTVLYPMRGVSELARMTPEAVEAKYGVPPARYPELAALVGETSDNLPGVPGVGQGYAAKWLNQYDGLDNVIDHADEITGKKGEALRAHLADVMRNRRLNALVRDLDLDAGPGRPRAHDVGPAGRSAAARRARVPRRPAHPAARGRRQRLGRARSTSPASSWPASGWRRARWPPGWPPTPPATARTGVAVQGSWRGGTGEVWSVALAAADGTAAWLDAAEVTPDDDAALVAWFADPERGQGAPRRQGPDAGAGRPRLGAARAGQRHRPRRLPRPPRPALLRPGRPHAALPQARAAHRTSTDDGPGRAVLRHDRGDQRRPGRRDAPRPGGPRPGRGPRRRRSRSTAAPGCSAEMELPLVDLLAEMEQIGIAVDLDHLESLESHFADEVKQAAEDAFAVIGKEINLGSPKQLQVVLFDELDMPKTKRTKTGWTTDADALQSLYEKTEHPFLTALLRHRDVARLRQTIEGLLKTVAPDGRIHTTFNQTIAATGRLSSTDPNLQNIPIRTEEGRRIREGFVVGRGLRVA